MAEIPSHITITHHAWRQFVRRWPFERPTCLTDEFRKLLRLAIEEDLGAGAVLRMMANGNIPARYFTIDGWRFVTDEMLERVVTVERVVHKRPKKRATGRRRARRSKW